MPNVQGATSTTSQPGQLQTINFGKSRVEYKTAQADNSNSFRAYQALRNAKINAIYCDGQITRTVNGKIISSTEAVTAPDGSVFVSNRSTVPAKEIYDHECIHVAQRKNSPEYLNYEDVICSNLIISSITFEKICKDINQNYFDGAYDISDPENGRRFIDEIVAYINQFVLSDPEFAEQTFGGMFSDWGAVVGAGLMGTSASGNAYQEMLNLGYDKKQANTYSILVGTSEAALGYAFSGISKLGGAVTDDIIKTAISGIDNGIARFAIEFGGKIASEGLEEAAQEVLTPLFENIALGYDKNSFKDINWSEVAYSGLLGMLSSTGFSAVETAGDVNSFREQGQKNKRLTEHDLENYMSVGKTQHTRNKKTRMLEAGKKPILTSSSEITEYILNIIRGKASGEVRAYGIVGKRLAQAIKNKRKNLDVEGKFLELNADDLRESYKRHLTPKEEGDIALTETDFVSIPEYVDNFDYVLGVNEYKGKIEIHLAKETDDGYVRILTVSSKERESLQITKIIGVSKEKFNEKYAKKERDTGSLRGLTDNTENSNPSTTAQHTAGTLSNINISQNDNDVNNIISSGAANNSENLVLQSNAEGGRGFRNPSTQEIYREPTAEEQVEAILGRSKDAKQRHITDIAKKLDSKMRLRWVDKNSEELGGKNGKYVRDTNTMFIAKDITVAEMYAEVFKHEFLHRLEGRGTYASFKSYLMERSAAFEQYARAQLKLLNDGKEFKGSREDAINELSRYYYNRFVSDKSIDHSIRKKFTMESAGREIVADFAGEVLFKGKENRADIAQALSEEDITAIGDIDTSMRALEEMANTDRSLFQKIIDVIKEFIRKLSGNPQTKRLVEDLEYIEQRLTRVFDSRDTKKAAKNSGGEQYSISSDENIENENIANGKKAIDELIDKADKNLGAENLSIKNAMYRSDLGYIDFVWGKSGEGPKFKKGYGLAHIIAKRDAESGNGKEVAYELVNVLAKGTEIEIQRVQNVSGNDRIRIFYNNYTAVLSESPEGNRWLLTGWENKEETTTSAIGEVRDSSKATTVTPTLTRRNGDAAASKISISNSGEEVKQKEVLGFKTNESVEKGDVSFSMGSPMQQARENLTKYENGEISREEYL